MKRRFVVLALAWLVIALPTALMLWFNSPGKTVIAGHDVVVKPTLDGWATLDFGPYLPDFRYPTDNLIGADIVIGKTTVTTYDALIERYAAIAASPQAQIDKLRDTVVDSAINAAVIGAFVGLLAPLLIITVGWDRWGELFAHMTTRRTEIGIIAVLLGAYIAYYSFLDTNDEQVAQRSWQPLSGVVPSVTLPPTAAKLEIDRGLFTSGSTALVNSVVASWESSQTFYTDLEALVADLGPSLHQPADGETVGMLVSDRHDNINMDPVARALFDVANATFLMNAGDDTSTGSEWEGFSLESLGHAFSDVDHKYGVAGNHDEGDFVVTTFESLGFTMLVGKPVEGPEGIRLLGASDPRSSGLGSWLTETEITLPEQAELLADRACEENAEGRRIATMLVHDATVGRVALQRGCVDLVLAGHRHDQVGPTLTVGENGRTGYEFTTGTTGGAAYAIALGSKLRRNAMITLVTYRDGRPVGLQTVTFRTVKDVVVGPYTPLTLNSALEVPSVLDPLVPELPGDLTDELTDDSASGTPGAVPPDAE